MNPGEKPPAPPVNPYVRLFLLGLPLGLVITGALSFVIYFQKRDASRIAASAPSPLAGLLRRDLNLEDYRRFIRVMEQEIGPRTPDRPQNLEAAQSFLESTLGFGNLGYQPRRIEVKRNGLAGAHLVADLPGRQSGGPGLLVVARYDGTEARDVAALLLLAQALSGTKHRQTIRFVALDAGGAERIEEELKRHELGTPGERGATGPVRPVGPPPDARDALERLKQIEREILQRAETAAP